MNGSSKVKEHLHGQRVATVMHLFATTGTQQVRRAGRSAFATNVNLHQAGGTGTAARNPGD